MRKSEKRKSIQRIKNLKAYLENLLVRAYTTFVVTPSGNFYEYEGDRIPATDFIKMFPLDAEEASRDGRNWN